MSDLMAPVKDGVLNYKSTTTESKSTKGTSALGKDAFLQLLVAQMKYQDPLNPSSDTEWISQLAQFSSLEQMQNLNTTFSNAQAFGLIGQTVVVTTKSETGATSEVQGVVDYVTISNGKTYVSIDDNLYLASEITSVVDTMYLAQQKAPVVPKQDITYDFDNPKDLKVALSLGEEEGAATGFVVLIGKDAVDSKYLTYDEKKCILTINQEAFSKLESGKTYAVSFGFNDALETTVTKNVTLTVKGTQPEATEEDKEDKTESA